MAQPPVIADQHLVKNMNRMVLLRLLRGEPGVSRADLAVRSGLTRSTVSVLIKELIDEGWLVESAAHVTGTPGR
jgi:DNA-binding MarR family transcriptional regulator